MVIAELLQPVRVSLAVDEPGAGESSDTARLVRLARDGDGDAFGQLVALHQRAAHRVARAALVQSHEADEAVQDACLTAWTRLGDLDRPDRFRQWLLSITWRKALDRRRTLTALWRRLRPVGEDDDDPMDRVPATGPSPLEAMTWSDRDRAIARVVRSLPPRLRDALLLAAAGEHRYDEIASILGVAEGTVKWRVSRARQVVKDKLARLGYGDR